MKRLIAIIGITVLAATAAGAQYYDYVDIGLPASESGHTMLGWGPVEPTNTGGGYGDAAGLGILCRCVWAPTDIDGTDETWADVDLDFGPPGGVKTLKIHYLDGVSNDAQDHFIDGNYLGEAHNELAGESWEWAEYDVSGYDGSHTIRINATDPPGPYKDHYGQAAIDLVGVEIEINTEIAPVAVDADPIACGGTKTVNFHFTNPGPEEIRGYSVQVQCSAELSFDEDDVAFAVQPPGATVQPFVTENVAGSDYTLDYTIMGGSVGIPTDVDLFSIDFHGAAEGEGTVSISYATLGALDGPPVAVSHAGTATVTMDCTASSVPTMDPEPAYTPGSANTVSWSDEAAGDAVEYYAECSADDFATVFANSGWIAGLSHEFTGLADGTTYDYRVRSRDAVGNESADSATVESTQDATPPETSIDQGPYWVDSFFDVTYEVDFEDGSGVAQVELFYRKDGGAWTSWGVMATPTVEFDASVLGEGVYDFYSIGTDAMGNAESAPSAPDYDAKVEVDATAPATHLDDPGLYHIDSFFDVTYTVESEDGSGVAQVELYYSYEGGAWTSYGLFTSSDPLEFDTAGTGGDGVYDFYTIGVDVAGNVEAAPVDPDASTTVDTSGPTVASFLINGGDAHTNDPAVTLDISVSDAVEMRFQNAGDVWSAWEAYDTTKAWTLSAGDDPAKTVNAEFKDSAGNVAPASDDIDFDTAPPAAVTGIDAVRGNNKVNLSWTNPGEDETTIEIWRGAWYHITAPDTFLAYPEYDDWPDEVIPARPASRDAAAVDPLWKRAATLTAPDASVVDDGGGGGLARCIYWYEVFVQDAAGNWSAPAAANDLAASYLLGDVVGGDGVIDLPYDVGNGLALCYGTGDGEPGYNNDCDVGPTGDYSGDGVPQTDDDIDFEDLMIFALNYDVALAKLPPAEGSPTARLAWADNGDGCWSLLLLEPCLDLKGLRLSADLPVRSVTGGRLLAEQALPCFAQNIPGRGLDAGLAVFGRGAGIAGSGELLRLSPVDERSLDKVVITARGASNERVEFTLEKSAALPELPTTYELSANHPNPFNPSTTIGFALPEAQRVKLSIYAVDGRRIVTLVDEAMPAGRHEAVWTGRSDRGEVVASGIYFYRIEAGPFSRTSKMTLLK